jgi:hypothetical protein
MRAMMSPRDRRHRVRFRLRQLLDAVDQALAAAREVERARDALATEAERMSNIRLVEPQKDREQDEQ